MQIFVFASNENGHSLICRTLNYKKNLHYQFELLNIFLFEEHNKIY